MTNNHDDDFKGYFSTVVNTVPTLSLIAVSLR